MLHCRCWLWFFPDLFWDPPILPCNKINTKEECPVFLKDSCSLIKFIKSYKVLKGSANFYCFLFRTNEGLVPCQLQFLAKEMWVDGHSPPTPPISKWHYFNIAKKTKQKFNLKDLIVQNVQKQWFTS